MKITYALFDVDVPMPGRQDAKSFYNAQAKEHEDISATLHPELLSLLFVKGDKHVLIPLTRVKRYHLSGASLAELLPAPRPEPAPEKRR